MRKAVVVAAVLVAALALPAGQVASASGIMPSAAPLGVAAAASAPSAAPLSGVPAQSWCRAVLPAPKDTARKAARIRKGRVDMGIYGWFRLEAQPTWQPAATLDSSGNTHMHGLHWAIPLLYHGMAKGDRTLVDRFYEVLGSWWATFPPDLPRSSAQDQSIVAGMRLWTLTCASEMAATAGQDQVHWAGVAGIEARRLLDRFAIVPGTNNTALYAQSAALAATCQAGDAPGATRALGNLSALADHLVLPDGSDLEGSPHYALHTVQLLAKANRLADRCGLAHERLDAALARAQEFLAFATRPDGVLETLGDSPGSRAKATDLSPGGPALFAATSGRTGRPPAALYRTFEGGYAFGRSRWGRPGGSTRDTTSATWYSVRTGRGPAPTAHTHDDISSVTVTSRGVRWIGDPGPWRYDRSGLRRAVVARPAHATIVVIPLPPASPPPLPPADPLAPAPPADPSAPAQEPPPALPWTPPTPAPASRLTAASSDRRSDLTCIEDLTYPTAAITRCVRFDRKTGALVVEDVITARESSRIEGRWQVPPRVRVTGKGPVITLRSSGKRATLTLGGTPEGAMSIARTWFTTSYGAKALGRTVLRQVDLEAGQSVTWRMELRAKK
jgi:hypothetical protein